MKEIYQSQLNISSSSALCLKLYDKHLEIVGSLIEIRDNFIVGELSLFKEEMESIASGLNESFRSQTSFTFGNRKLVISKEEGNCNLTLHIDGEYKAMVCIPFYSLHLFESMVWSSLLIANYTEMNLASRTKERKKVLDKWSRIISKVNLIKIMNVID